MNGSWDYQIRIDLDDTLADAARCHPGDPAIQPLMEILGTHHAALKCQFDAFADYVAEAEQQGIENYPLYAWTKATIENPDKRARYLRSFTIYVEGNEVYAAGLAEAIEADLRPLADSGVIARLSKYDTNPANSPQPPAQHRR